MALSNREISEVATKIRDQLSLRSLSGYSELSKELAMLVVSIERLKNFGRRLELCAARKWQAAAAVVSREVVNTLPCLVRDIGAVESSANRLDTAIPSLGELVAELRQSEREFGQLSYDRKERFVAAVTDPIELEGMHLGEFEIRLLLDSHCSRQDQDKRYRIVALDPHPAGSDETVTHPHVRGEYLCPGDAAAAIRSALRSGRICDFFLLVRSVLGEYNPQSAFITLANWDGTACYECGYTIGSGEVYGCASCEHDFCSECISTCCRCDESLCQNCLVECTVCKESVCSACLTRCPDCRRAICQSCREDDQCPCKRAKEDHDESNHTTPIQDDRTESDGAAQLQTN